MKPEHLKALTAIPGYADLSKKDRAELGKFVEFLERRAESPEESLVDAHDEHYAVRPTREDLYLAVENIKELVSHARRSAGPPALDELQKVSKWLKWTARQKPSKS